MLQLLKDKLTLTDAQTPKVKAVLDASRQKMMALRDDDSLSDDDKKAKMKEIQTDQKAQIRALLTPDQQKIFDTLKMPNGGHRKKEGESGGADTSAPPPPPPAPPSS